MRIIISGFVCCALMSGCGGGGAGSNARVTVDTSSQKKEDFTAIIEWNIMGEIEQKN